jgi:signal transduction histidine kinase
MAAIKTLHLKYPTAKDRVKLQIEAKDLAQLSVHCDPVLLQAAFFNLLDNAMKYGDEKPFSVRLMPQENWVCLEVTDQGQGISPPQMEHLFEPFYRIYRANNPPGSGIGLSLVKSIVDKSGGKIELHSIPGEGTSARLYLPQFFEK